MAELRQSVDRTKRQRAAGRKPTSGSAKRETAKSSNGAKRTTKKPARKAS